MSIDRRRPHLMRFRGFIDEPDVPPLSVAVDSRVDTRSRVSEAGDPLFIH